MTVSIDLIELGIFLVILLLLLGLCRLGVWFRLNFRIQRRQWKKLGSEWIEVD